MRQFSLFGIGTSAANRTPDVGAKLLVPDVWVREPLLMVPRQKPIGSVKIDWSNPITKGLMHCFLFNSISSYCLVTRKEAQIKENAGVAGNEKVVATRLGKAVYVTQSAPDVGYRMVLARPLTDTPGFSYFTHNIPHSSNGSMGGLCAADLSVYLGMYTKASGENIIATVRGASNRIVSSVTYLWNTGDEIRAVITGSAGQCASYWPNGEAITESGTTFTYTDWQLHYYVSGSDQGRSNYLSAFIWERPLVAIEAKSIVDDPYQFLIPA